MPITVSWYNDEKTAIKWEITGDWYAADYHSAVDQSMAMMATVDHKVDVIGDVTHANKLPGDVVTTINTRHQAEEENAINYGNAVIVGGGLLIKSLIRIASTMPYTKDRFYCADTYDEAEDLLATFSAERATSV